MLRSWWKTILARLWFSYKTQTSFSSQLQQLYLQNTFYLFHIFILFSVYYWIDNIGARRQVFVPFSRGIYDFRCSFSCWAFKTFSLITFHLEQKVCDLLLSVHVNIRNIPYSCAFNGIIRSLLLLLQINTIYSVLLNALLTLIY